MTVRGTRRTSFARQISLLRKTQLGKGGAGTSDRRHRCTLAQLTRLARRRATGDFVTLAHPTLFSSSCCTCRSGMGGSSEGGYPAQFFPLGVFHAKSWLRVYLACLVMIHILQNRVGRCLLHSLGLTRRGCDHFVQHDSSAQEKSIWRIAIERLGIPKMSRDILVNETVSKTQRQCLVSALSEESLETELGRYQYRIFKITPAR